MKNDEAARQIEELFGTWAPSLVRYAYRSTNSCEVAEDLVQEVFMSLYRQLVAGKWIDNVKGWTLNALRNQISKYHRDRQRRREDFQAQSVLDLMPGADLRQAAIENDDISGMLSVLTRREEEVVLLRMEAMKYREIGVQLGISPKTVSTLLTRALQKLHQLASAGGAASTRQEKHERQTLQ